MLSHFPLTYQVQKINWISNLQKFSPHPSNIHISHSSEKKKLIHLKNSKNLHHLPIEKILKKKMVKTCKKFSTTWFSHLATTIEQELSEHPIFNSHHHNKMRIERLLDLHLSPLPWNENWAIAQFSWPTTTKEWESGPPL